MKRILFSFLVSAMALGVMLAGGCATDSSVVKVTKTDTETKAVLYKEAGYNLTNYFLKNESSETLKTAKTFIDGLLQIIEKADVTEAVGPLTAYISAYDFGENAALAELGTSLLRIIAGYYDIEILVPKEYAEVKSLVTAFLTGAMEGAG